MRLFTAIPLSTAITDRLGALCSGVPGVKWADPDQMHITLRFIGDVDGPTASDIAGALDGVRGEPFDLDLATIGHFGTGHRLRTLWVGVAESPGLEQLQFRVDRAVSTVMGPTETRKFHAHVTLGRLKRTTPNLAGYLAQHEPFRAGPVSVKEFVLYSSHLGSERAIHTAEARYPLSP
ncbi:MAG: RNA 2',3'-cyclic phosphodiesterase [Alphaproteobacteria bacterium]|jgi:RNA 2',3'-cyclic 3'-phosphodiesterase|nr:RNA 2',3'-cyclic phosphodiesterase [Alphaproteobacteria bacterium]MBT5860027.1 RNA 2',3'-cyclic phosphodiesterase [Alphaproteobacteria bacterium]